MTDFIHFEGRRIQEPHSALACWWARMKKTKTVFKFCLLISPRKDIDSCWSIKPNDLLRSCCELILLYYGTSTLSKLQNIKVNNPHNWEELMGYSQMYHKNMLLMNFIRIRDFSVLECTQATRRKVCNIICDFSMRTQKPKDFPGTLLSSFSNDC